ncbi:MAG: benzoate/H(+) symporter BenE family transporter [Magnetovibrionaceae bacterium]
MLKSFSFTHLSAGFVAILVGYTSSAAIIFQAALAAGAGPEEVASWMWALGLGLGLGGIGLSLFYKAPIMLAWSTPGAALLVTSLSGISMAEAIGAFFFSSALMLLCGLTGLFDRFMTWVPESLARAMLAGILLQFGLSIFPAFESSVIMVGAMVTAFVIGTWRRSAYTIPMTFLTGVVIALVQGRIDVTAMTFELTTPVWTTPSFDPAVLIGIGLPLFIVTMASQNVPGLATLRAHDYKTPASPIISLTGALGLIFGGLGGFAYNLAAITAALCMGEHVDKDPKRRYWGAVWAGVFYLLAGLFGATVASFFASFPQALVATIAGLALLGTIATSLHVALARAEGREAAILTFVITASSGSLLDIAAPFWGLVCGLGVHYLLTAGKRNPKAPS